MGQILGFFDFPHFNFQELRIISRFVRLPLFQTKLAGILPGCDTDSEIRTCKFFASCRRTWCRPFNFDLYSIGIQGCRCFYKVPLKQAIEQLPDGVTVDVESRQC